MNIIFIEHDINTHYNAWEFLIKNLTSLNCRLTQIGIVRNRQCPQAATHFQRNEMFAFSINLANIHQNESSLVLERASLSCHTHICIIHMSAEPRSAHIFPYSEHVIIQNQAAQASGKH